MIGLPIIWRLRTLAFAVFGAIECPTEGAWRARNPTAEKNSVTSPRRYGEGAAKGVETLDYFPMYFKWNSQITKLFEIFVNNVAGVIVILQFFFQNLSSTPFWNITILEFAFFKNDVKIFPIFLVIIQITPTLITFSIEICNILNLW